MRTEGPDKRTPANPFAGCGALLALVRAGSGASRAALVNASELSRATVSQRLAHLFRAGLVTETDQTLPSGGRPARVLRVNPSFGVVLAADIGESSFRVGVTDLDGTVIAHHLFDCDLRVGPEATLTRIAAEAEVLLRRARLDRRAVLGIGVSLPAPVDFAAGKVVGPSIMTGWDEFDICGWLSARLGVEAVADNDVNLLALHEHRTYWRNVDDFFFVKAGTGIGSGIFAGGVVYRGANGAAGDIGHIQLGVEDGPLCRCGKLGCVEARAAGWAIARDLRVLGIEAHDAKDVVALAEQNRPEVVKLLRQSGRVIGEAISDAVSILNPSVIIVGGTLARTGDRLLSGIRELVYQRCLPLATRQLTVALSQADPLAGLRGAAQLAVDRGLAPDRIDRILAERPARPPSRRRRQATADPHRSV